MTNDVKAERDAIVAGRFELAQLRHAYTHLKAERVIKQAEFADGLIAPAIRRFERLLDAIESGQHLQEKNSG